MLTIIKGSPDPTYIYCIICPECKSRIKQKVSNPLAAFITCPVCGVDMFISTSDRRSLELLEEGNERSNDPP